jgi:hypothetical protein
MQNNTTYVQNTPNPCAVVVFDFKDEDSHFIDLDKKEDSNVDGRFQQRPGFSTTTRKI